MSHPTQIVHRHFRGLDGLRGLAFLMVFAFHYAMSSHGGGLLTRGLLRATQGGWMGVDLFFVLSGFLITGILLDTRDGPDYFRNFYARRSLRIFPLFYGVLLLLLLLTPVLHLHWRPGHAWYFLYLGNFAGAYDFTLNDVQPAVHLTHLWSLAVEEQFYLIWPLVVLKVRSRRNLLRTAAGILLGSMALRLFLVHSFGTAALEWSYGLLPTHADGLIAGSVCAVLFRKYDTGVLVRRSLPLLLVCGVLLGLLFWHVGALNYHEARFAVLGYPLLATVCSCLLLRFAMPGHLLERLGSTATLRFFGRYSYGMYVFHNLFVLVTTPLLRGLQRATGSMMLGGAAYFTLILAITSVCAVLSFHFYEQRWLRLKRRFEYRSHAERTSLSAPNSLPEAAADTPA